MQIDVQPMRAARAAAAAAELAALLRRAAGQIEVTSPASGGARAQSSWASVWVTLRPALLGLAARGEDLASAIRAAAVRFQETEDSVTPDVP